jgi:hypothetical protein
MATRAGEHARAAAYYAKAGRSVSFEQVCLGFLEKGEDKALALYLQRRLDATDRAKEPEAVTKIASWLADLHVSRACQAEAAAADAAAAGAAAAGAAGAGVGAGAGGGGAGGAAVAEAASSAATVGAVQVESSCPISLKPPGFNL